MVTWFTLSDDRYIKELAEPLDPSARAGDIQSAISREECGSFERCCRNLQIPKSFRALALRTFGLISSRISSLAKSDSQRSGVITGQSEPNSILSCRMELM